MSPNKLDPGLAAALILADGAEDLEDLIADLEQARRAASLRKTYRPPCQVSRKPSAYRTVTP